MIEEGAYSLPDGQLSLSGPRARPATGTLPIRGDLAHIALAERYLCAHYVIPHLRTVGAAGADLLCQQRDRTDVVTRLEPGTRVEALDYAGNWCWCCLGPEGPSGYLHLTELEPAD
ncbi:hypothetical protein A6F68_01477 [Tsuneonella dongtanensis]|uniref:Bacterial dipeptidyl-peptidase SH3 domain-containing protein n=1 Tax=Tsuneonella dongtanensis TaxID=692370 RepID=A0A1B2ACW2_9SPHN|nr:hypothetical protein [Tsuneonella dongtanensis]ANY19993.1 hypothetical protein A6F68_01477 [Tsuneonella dongtanensis]